VLGSVSSHWKDRLLHTCSPALPASSGCTATYLRDQTPCYPFRPRIDQPFVQELTADFPQLLILDEIKAFRWYHDNDPVSRVRNVRLALRRWLARACKPKTPTRPLQAR